MRLTDEDVERLRLWNQTEMEYPRAACVHHAVERWAQQTPERIALHWGIERVTYRELNTRADALAGRLRRRGIGRGALVAILLDRSPQLLVAFLAVLKSGAAYLPLDPLYPRQRNDAIMLAAETTLVLTEECHLDLCTAAGTPALVLDGPEDDDSLPEVDASGDAARADDLAYVVYTSGSTGVPKGVELEHGNLVNLLYAMANLLQLTTDCCVLALSTVAFDMTALEFFLPLTAGGAVALAPPETAADGERLAALLVDHGVTVLQATPPTWRLLLATGWSGRLELTAISGGEALTPELAAALLPRVRSLWNGYGPTETTNYSTIQRVEQADGPTPIGRPIANTTLYVVDEEGAIVAPGTTGELWIGGIGVTRGYRGRPDLTAERYVEHNGERVYRTGDRVCLREDGALQFHGRADDQIKLRGFRIEPAEIEAALRTLSDIEDAAVVLRAPDGEEVRLVAYVTGANALSERALRAALRERLPSWMIPSSFVQLGRLPMTPNGKTDRKALAARPEPVRARTAPGHPPSLAAIWSELLTLDDEDPGGDFFERGGHSLLAMRLLDRIETAFARRIPLVTFLADPTLSGLATALRVPSEVAVTPRRGGSVVAPLSSGQRQIWITGQLAPGRPVYNEAVTIRFQGALDVPALCWSLNEIIARHEAWRTIFPVEGGEPVQRVLPQWQLAVPPLVDLSHLPPAERPNEATRLASEDARRPFDLAATPPLRALLIRLAIDDYRLYLTIHHIIFDGVSMASVFQRELSELYAARTAGRDPKLPALTIQYSDYAARQQERESPPALDRHLAYWRERLTPPAACLSLPSVGVPPPVPTFRGATSFPHLPAELSSELRALARRQNTTLYTVLLAAFSVVLARFSGQEDIQIGSVSAGRDSAEVAALLGYFLRTLVLRLDLSADPRLDEVLARTWRTVREALAHQDVPFEQLVRELQPERSGSQNPLFGVMLTLDPPVETPDPRWSLSTMDIDTGTSKFDLALFLCDAPEGIAGRLEYSLDRFDGETMATLMAHYTLVLQAFVDWPEGRLSDLPRLTPEEAERVAGWNRTEAPYPENAALQDAFERWAGREPERVALLWEGERITYGELNARAETLAHRLRHRGIAGGALVAVLLQRSPEMLVALLGVLKTGAAYLPLDPLYPRRRVEEILRASGASLLITEERYGDAHPEVPATLVIDRDAEVNVDLASPVPSNEPTVSDLAYVIYTSGSTGTPKGVEVEHHSVVNLLQAVADRVGIDAGSRLLAVTTIAFDIAGLELFLPLTVGGSIVLAPADVAADGERLLALLESSGATVLQATPATWRLLLASGWKGTPGLTLLCGGEALPTDLARGLVTRGDALWNLYGPTETTIWSTAQRIDGSTSPVTIGTPLANTTVHVLAADGSPVPPGVAGELYIGGVGVARGYRGRPGLTAERFIQYRGERVYRTGDRVCQHADGALEFLGRADDQLKLRGFRIEPAEIERVLRLVPGITDAAVLLHTGSGGDGQLVAYVSGTVPPDRTVRAALRERLPAWMVPSVIVRLAALPRTANGKTDRNALPAPVDVTQQSSTEPPSPAEHTLVAIWRELLGVEEITTRSDFFELGGHSLLAMRLLDRVEEVYGRRIPLATLLAAPTIEGLQHALLTAGSGDLHGLVVPVQSEGRRRPFFYLHGQVAGGAFYTLKLARRMGPDQPFYALQPHRSAGVEVPVSIEAIAASYVEAMRAVQSTGPYLLGGFCLHGVVALEMARQLRAAGDTVDLLALVHSQRPAFARTAALQQLLLRVAAFSDRSAADAMAWYAYVQDMREFADVWRRRPRRRQVREVAALLTHARRVLATRSAGTPPSLGFTRQERRMAPYVWAAATYEPPPYDGHVVLFRSRDDPADPYLGWQSLLDKIEVHRVPGHASVLREDVEELSHCLAAAVARAQGFSLDCHHTGNVTHDHRGVAAAE